MTAPPPRLAALALLALAAGGACSRATAGAGGVPGTAPEPARASTPSPRYEVRRQPYGAADVHFMTGMIAHHAQAVRMARMAPSHGASEGIRTMSERIIVAQRDEIALMQTWLRDRGEAAPEVDSTYTFVRLHGMPHDMLMPGMLTADELAQLDAARGPEFDRLMLTFMLRHHEGALVMVEQLFGSYGAAQDDVVFKLASDIFADQSSEIERMQTMLDALTSTGSAPR